MPRFSRFFAVLLAAVSLTSCDIPDQPDGARNGMGNIAHQLQAQGDDAGAADFYQRELQTRPDDADALAGLGALLEKRGDYAGAEKCYARALQLQPDNEDAQLAEGRVLIHLGRAGEAADLYRGILAGDDHNLHALNGVGVALDYQGRHDDAETAYQTALEEQPDDLVTLNNLAHSYVLAGRPDDAIRLLEPHAKDPNATPALRQNLAEAYGMAGMFADAERLSRMDLNPQQVKRNLAYYRARRASAGNRLQFAADLGSFATGEMAEGQMEKAAAITGEDASVKLSIKPQVQTIGGTPSFTLLATGFAGSTQMKAFCAHMAAGGIACKPAKDL